MKLREVNCRRSVDFYRPGPAQGDPGVPGAVGEDRAVEAGAGGDHVEVLAVLEVFAFEEFSGQHAAGLLLPLACRRVAAAAR